MIRIVLALSVVLLAASPALAAEADGKAVYAKNCAKCHGEDGHGQTPAGKALKATSLVDPKWAAPEALAKIEAAVRDGVPRMPPMKEKLSADEITASAKYTQQLAGGKP